MSGVKGSPGSKLTKLGNARCFPRTHTKLLLDLLSNGADAVSGIIPFYKWRPLAHAPLQSTLNMIFHRIRLAFISCKSHSKLSE